MRTFEVVDVTEVLVHWHAGRSQAGRWSGRRWSVRGSPSWSGPACGSRAGRRSRSLTT